MIIRELKRWGNYIAILFALVFVVVFINNYNTKTSSKFVVSLAKLSQTEKLKSQAKFKFDSVKANLNFVNQAEMNYPKYDVEEEVLRLLNEVKKIVERNNMTLKSAKPQLNDIEESDYVVSVKTIIEMVGTYPNLIKTLEQLESFNSSSSILSADIKFINKDALSANLVMVSLARPKLDAIELTPLSETLTDDITSIDLALPFGFFVDLESQKKAELEKLANENRVTETFEKIYIDDTPNINIKDNVNGIIIEDSKNDTSNSKVTVQDTNLYPFKTKQNIISSWGIRDNAVTKEKEFHYGIDISAPENTNVYPLKDGVVQFAGELPNYGKVVVIKYNDGLTSFYAHLGKFNVNKGDKVNKNTAVGIIASTEYSAVPVLHLGLVVGDVFVNPNEYIKFN